MWHTNRHTCESRAAFYWGRICTNLMDQMQEYEEIIPKKWGQSLLFWILTMKCYGWNIVLGNFMKCLKFCWCKTFHWQIARLDQMSSTMVSYFIVCFQPHDEDFEKSMFTMKFDRNIPSWVFFENHFKISSHLIQTKHIRRLRVFLDSWHLWHCHLKMSIHSVVWPNSFGIVVVVVNVQSWELLIAAEVITVVAA